VAARSTGSDAKRKRCRAGEAEIAEMLFRHGGHKNRVLLRLEICLVVCFERVDRNPANRLLRLEIAEGTSRGLNASE
jgi:hypothetical protein